MTAEPFAPHHAVRSLYPGAHNSPYLDTAAVGIVSTHVYDAMAEVVAQHRDAGVGPGAQWREMFWRVRGLAAHCISGAVDRIALTQNTSTGLAMVVNGLDWRPGDNVVIPEGEFPSNFYPWWQVRRNGVEVRTVPMVEGRALPGDIAAAMDGRTRVVSISAVHYASGFRYDLVELGDLLEPHDALLVVDGTQAVGAMRVDVAAARIDVLAVSAHKWLLGPLGIGFVHLSERAFQDLVPSTVGWMSVDDPFAFTRTPVLANDGRRFESGTENAAGIAGLGATLDIIASLGPGTIERMVLERAGYLSELLLAQGFSLPYLYAPERRSGIVLATKGSDLTPAIHRRLTDHGVRCSLREGNVRFSPHYFNSADDLTLTADLAGSA
jgi:selenocysteine lyase/cysteine desulfurase